MTGIRPSQQRPLRGAGGAVIASALWQAGGEPLLCVHGLTSSSMAFAGLATELPDSTVLAVDCRGRGKSAKGGPFGLSWHVADLVAIMDDLGIARATVVGHSMGAYVAGALAAEHPERVTRLVLVDGGHFLPFPEGTAPEMLLAVMLGPFLEKLRRTWSSLDEYIGFYGSTPLYPDGVDEYGRAHFSYDLTGEPPQLRARIAGACIAADWRDILDHAAVSRRLEAVAVPVLLVRAPGGLTGTGDAVVPDQVREAITSRVARCAVVDVPGTNHHTVLFSKPGARAVARAVARALEGFLR